MTFKPKTWYPIAVGLAAINLVAIGFATDDAWHMAGHVALAVAFGAWARHLRRRSEVPTGEGDLQTRIEELEAEANRVRQELSEAQERLDFTERMLAQSREQRRVGPER